MARQQDADLSAAGTAASPRLDRAMPLLRVANATKRFGDVMAVDNLSLDIQAGEFFALLGPSGCGKTTLLRMLAGFEQPEQGRILLGGVDIAPVPPHLRPVNMMFQNYALFPHLDVVSNIAFGLKRSRLSGTDISERVEEMLALTRLKGLERRKPHQLSGGQRQRVALARSLARRPQLLLLDEPLAALDKQLREATQTELKALQRKLGLTFIIVTHDQDEAMTVADRIGVMNNGRLIQVATPRSLYETPVSRWVAGFVGDINLLEGVVMSQANGLLTLRTSDAGLVVVASTMESVAGMSVSIAIRPEKIRIAADQASADFANTLRGEVVEVTYLGGVSVYRVRLRSGVLTDVRVPNHVRAEAAFFSPGQKVLLSFSPDAALVLET